MGFYHPRFSSTGSLQSAPKPHSEWAKAHAAQISKWPEKAPYLTISDSRTSTVNFSALQHAVQASMGQKCIRIEWVAEGGCNQLYLVTLSDGYEILARIAFPYPHAVRTGQAFAHQESYDRARIPSRMESEVATIRHIQTHAEIPVARVYAYDSNLTNPVGSPYMLQEVLQGENLSQRWRGMVKYVWQDAATISLGKICGAMMSLNFDGYGSLKPDASNQSVLGPRIEPVVSLHRHQPTADAGPWPANQPTSPYLALAARELQWLESSTGRQLFDDWRGKMYPKEDRSKTFPAFLELAQNLVDIVPHMYSLFPLPEGACRPTLFHPDFHTSNILVSQQDPTLVTGIVDWEFASILPLWNVYRVPSFLRDFGSDESDPEWTAHKARLRVIFEQTVLQACPDAAIVAQPGDQQTEQSLCALRLLSHIATSGVALYDPIAEVGVDLAEIRGSVAVDGGPIVEKLDHLVTLFSHFV